MNTTIDSNKVDFFAMANNKEVNFENRRFSASKDHLYSNLNGKGVILSMKNDKYYGVNEVGASIWNVLQTPTTLTNIIKELMDEYEVDKPTCEKQVVTFLQKLQKDGLVEIFDEEAD